MVLFFTTYLWCVTYGIYGVVLRTHSVRRELRVQRNAN